MSEDSFTIDEIQKAFNACFTHTRGNQLPDLIAELQKPDEPAWTPKVGQCVARVDNGNPYRWCHGFKSEYRPLTATEIGLEPFEHRDVGFFVTDGHAQGYAQACDDHNEQLFPGDTE